MSHLARPARRCANDCSVRRQGWARVRELTYVLGFGRIAAIEMPQRCGQHPGARSTPTREVLT